MAHELQPWTSTAAAAGAATSVACISTGATASCTASKAVAITSPGAAATAGSCACATVEIPNTNVQQTATKNLFIFIPFKGLKNWRCITSMDLAALGVIQIWGPDGPRNKPPKLPIQQSLLNRLVCQCCRFIRVFAER